MGVLTRKSVKVDFWLYLFPKVKLFCSTFLKVDFWLYLFPKL